MSLVLIVKKDKRERMFLMEKLEEKGHRVEEANEIKEAIDKLTEFNVDFVVIDFDILEKNQSSFLKAINQQIPPPYIIVSKKPSEWKEPY
ncbi:MAG TPA: response regulator, partial [Candidatus Desulfofervidus auxilii]|nr:response regulator [Candidatus Desulfofervidus auxilii]